MGHPPSSVLNWTLSRTKYQSLGLTLLNARSSSELFWLLNHFCSTKAKKDNQAPVGIGHGSTALSLMLSHLLSCTHHSLLHFLLCTLECTLWPMWLLCQPKSFWSWLWDFRTLDSGMTIYFFKGGNLRWKTEM